MAAALTLKWSPAVYLFDNIEKLYKYNINNYKFVYKIHENLKQLFKTIFICY